MVYRCDPVVMLAHPPHVIAALLEHTPAVLEELRGDDG